MAYQAKDQSALIHRQTHVVLWDESLDDDTVNDGEKRLTLASSVVGAGLADESLKSGGEGSASRNEIERDC